MDLAMERRRITSRAQVPATLATLQQRRYTQFSLITDKAKIHAWQPQLALGALQPYAP